jgi:hypothetical protein
MSTHIVHGLLAIRFDKDWLKDAAPKARQYEFFREDRYLLLELGGPNNLTEPHPQTGREVTSRDWAVVAYGQQWETMREAVRMAAECEGGMLRLSGNRDTQAEDYIKSARKALADALTPAQAAAHGVSLSAEIAFQPPSQDVLKNFAGIPKRAEEKSVVSFHLSPLREAEHAALLMLHGRESEGKPWDTVKAQGPRFPCEGQALFDRMSGKAAAKQEAMFEDDENYDDHGPR